MTFEQILGPPGCGKTTELLRLVETYLASGVPPDRLAYISFTKKAVNEAIERACEKFKLQESDLPFFRTIHSLAFRQLGLNRSQVMRKEHFKQLGEMAGIRMSGFFDMDEGSFGGYQVGDRLLFAENLARIRGVPLEVVWRDIGEDLELHPLQHVSSTLALFKKERGMYDFTDMLSLFVKVGVLPKLEVLIVDEAQDLSTLQWHVVDKLKACARFVHIAGDDDQAIFRWAGADVDHFTQLSRTPRVLAQSYRVPVAIQGVANQVIQRVSSRAEKQWSPRDDVGEVRYYRQVDDIDMSEGSWLVLARNTHILKNAEEHCRHDGYHYRWRSRGTLEPDKLRAIQWYTRLSRGEAVPVGAVREICKFTSRPAPGWLETADTDQTVDYRRLLWENLGIWHEEFDRVPVSERTYLVSCLRRGEKLTSDARVILSTIHGAKGGEAENVAVFLDMAPRSYDWYRSQPDDELRVLYVALTRAKAKLHIIEPRTPKHFEL